ncbi:MAG TPA: FAD-binding oxidoreductase [Thermoplasmata archaeon]|nr:FAD-binding oxidoreductase [Thermoplasmata archaeon]
MGRSLGELRAVLPADRMVIGSDVPPRYRLDAFRAHRGSRQPEGGVPPAAVVWPRSADDVSKTLRFAAKSGYSVVPWGGGTGLMGGARPMSRSIVLDMRHMRRIREIDVASGTVTAEAGIVLEDLDRRLRRRRLSLGHDPWSRPRATLGGAIGTNGIGYAGYLRGTMGDQVLGLEVVLLDGTLVRTRPVARSTTGLDLKRLFIGTEGTLGIITAATLRVFPVPDREEIRAFALPSFSIGLHCIEGLYNLGLVPSVMDFEQTFDGPALPWSGTGGHLRLYLGFAGSREIVGASWRLARSHLRRAGARSLPDREARSYWRTRHDIIYVHDEISPGTTRADVFLKDFIFDYVHVALPRSKILAYRHEALSILRRHRVSPIGFGIWTQPELVSLEMIRPVGKDRVEAKAAVATAVDEVIRWAQDLGGTMEYVHGVGVKLAHLMERELGSGLEVTRRVKKALDPKGVLNPGKLGL